MARRKFKRKIRVSSEAEQETTDTPQSLKDFAEEGESQAVEPEPVEDSAPEPDPEPEPEPQHEEEALVQAPQEVQAHEPQTVSEVDQELVERLKAEASEHYDKYLRSVAEFENFKKRSIKERSDLLRYAGENLARDMLDVVDALELACKHEVDEGSQELMTGVKLVLDLFNSSLEKHSIRGLDSAGKPFDPEKHEALSQIETADFKPGLVVEEFKKAYFFKDKLLRPAQVVVAKQPQSEDEE